jgi:rhodanese-related sulfurtransferase
MKHFFSAVLLIAFAFTSISFAEETVVFVGEAVKEVSVKEVQQYVQAKAANVAILDANNPTARKSAGVLPGAVLLSSYNQYALSELPTDKNTTLVFYCFNSYCQASHVAAERAIAAGYKDARVMKAGIAGWNKANLNPEPNSI